MSRKSTSRKSAKRKTFLVKNPRSYVILSIIFIALFALVGLYVLATSSKNHVLGVSTASGLPSHQIVSAVYEETTQKSSGASAAYWLHKLGANFVFRGTFQWGKGSPAKKYSKVPGMVYEGGIGTQYLENGSIWPDGTIISNADFNSMTDNRKYPYSNGYIPDLASPLYQKYLIGWGEVQINNGVDGMFFDSPYPLAKYATNLSAFYTHYGTYLFSDVVGPLKTYARLKGRTFFATINGETCDNVVYYYAKYPAAIAPSDYITCTFSVADFNKNNISYVKENFKYLTSVVNNFGHHASIITFIDWPNTFKPYAALPFADKLIVLKKLYTATKKENISFAFPVHVGGIPYDAEQDKTFDTMYKLVNVTQN